MDGSGANPSAFSSLTDLAMSGLLQPGDTIRIQGLTGPSGLPVAYSNVPVLPFQTAENFSLLILPHGIRLQPNDAKPVYLAAAGGLVPAALLTISGTASTTAVKTRIGRITFIGGQVGLLLDESGTSGHKSVEVREATFCANGIGLSAVASGTTILPTIVDCNVTDSHVVLEQNTMRQAQSIGVRLHGLDGAGQVAGRNVARIENLITSGIFLDADMAPLPFTEPDTDLQALTSVATRLVEAFGSGGIDEHDDQNPFLTVPISEVTLDVHGGSWHGYGGEDRGWDLGLYAATASSGNTNSDYTCGFSVNFSGTQIRQFQLAGIHATASATSRGAIACLGQTTVQDTGLGLTAPPAGGYAHSGIHLYTFLGYLGLVATDANLYANRGNGIWLHARASGSLDFPTGIYLRALRCKIHQSGLDGIAMEAGTDSPDNPSRGEGIVGGTWDRYGGYLSLIDQSGEPAQVEHGVGEINRCAISNNGRYGVRAKVRGRREDDQDSDDAFSTVNCRIVNSILWNNPQGGVFAALEEASSGTGSPSLLMPIVHCTIVGNGDASGWNAEVTDVNFGTSSAGKFEYASGPPTGSPTEFVVCRFNNTIFQNKVALSEDFGPQLVARVVQDFQVPGFVADTALGVEACRYATTNPTPQYTIYTESDISSAFVGPISWTSLAASQFYLVNTGPNNVLNFCIPWNEAAPFESSRDYTEFTRTAILTDRDIGAYQKDPR